MSHPNQSSRKKQKGLTIALVGLPNAGKSTLVNTLIGEPIAPIHPKPQMTRHNLLGILTTNTHQLVFIDTPGLHAVDQKLNHLMMAEMELAVVEADVVCALIEVNRPFPEELAVFLSERCDPGKVVIALNKTDLPQTDWITTPAGFPRSWRQLPLFEISGLSGQGLEALVNHFQKMAKPQPFLYAADDLTTTSCRDLAVQYVREGVMEYLHQEIPYQIGVVIDEFQEKPGRVAVKATIVVNKESQKGMVIGKNGTAIAEIRRVATKRIAKLMNCPVTLSLFVRVDKNWIKNNRKIRDYF